MSLADALQSSYRGFMGGRELDGAVLDGVHRVWGPPVEVARNLAPPIEGSGTWAEVRRNLFTNPEASSLTRFSAIASQADLSLVDGVPRWTFTGITAAVSLSGLTMTAGDSYRLMLRVRANRTFNVTTRIGGLQNTDHEVGTEWRWIDITSPASSSPAFTGLLVQQAQIQAGDWLEISRALFAEGGDEGDYFSGSTPDFTVDPDMRTRWLGTENASESVMEIETVAGISGGFLHNGNQIRILDTATIDSPGTLLATTLHDSTIDGTPVTAGEHRIHTTDTITLGAGIWDNIGLHEGNYTGPFFDGDTPNQGRNIYEWTPDRTASIHLQYQ